MTTIGNVVAVAVEVDAGGNGVALAVGAGVGVQVKVGAGVAVVVALSDWFSSVVGVSLAMGVGGDVRVAVGSRIGVVVKGAVGAKGVSVSAGARDTPGPQAVIPHNNTTRPTACRILSISPLLILPIVLFQAQPWSNALPGNYSLGIGTTRL